MIIDQAKIDRIQGQIDDIYSQQNDAIADDGDFDLAATGVRALEEQKNNLIAGTNINVGFTTPFGKKLDEVNPEFTDSTGKTGGEGMELWVNSYSTGDPDYPEYKYKWMPKGTVGLGTELNSIWKDPETGGEYNVNEDGLITGIHHTKSFGQTLKTGLKAKFFMPNLK